ncbi:MAG: 2-C-methyl-D-erythritol 4-phosphate cytidylyltransferase [bacterium]|nr:2-C-methyl-D-erythritol 4-phosphate cytidylyltransferase [bacterium]
MGVDFLVPAAGSGQRMELGHNKLFVSLGGQPVLLHTLRALLALPSVERLLLIYRQGELEQLQRLCRSIDWGRVQPVWIEGGTERADSVRNGLRYLLEHPGAEVAMTHDAARPFLSGQLYNRLLAALKSSPAAVPALPIAETTRRALKDGRTEVVEREGLYLTQTPQAFLAAQIKPVFFGPQEHLTLTDEAGYFEQVGLPVALVPGDPLNIKLTRPADLLLAQAYLALNQS